MLSLVVHIAWKGSFLSTIAFKVQLYHIKAFSRANRISFNIFCDTFFFGIAFVSSSVYCLGNKETSEKTYLFPCHFPLFFSAK